MTDAWKRLKSGSDIRGVAIATQGNAQTLTPEIGYAVGAAFARWLALRLGKAADSLVVSVGRDSRLSGDALKAAMLAGLASAGVRALDCGLCTTPAMFMSTRLLQCDGAVMVTASHLPWQRNGYKFFTPAGGLDGPDIEAILDAALTVVPEGGATPAERAELLDAYVVFLKEKVCGALGDNRPLAGLHIVVDAGNGAGGFYADMLAQLGANTQGSQYLEPDGRFPAHVPNPEEPAAMEALGRAVLESGADLGVIFDADCDRAAMVDMDGKAINRNRLIALVSAMLLTEKGGITVVADSVVSAGLERFIHEKGGTLHRFKRGYRNVIDEAIRLNKEGADCPLAIETSGHAALRENHFLDDGMYLMTRLLIEAKRMQAGGKRLTALIDSLEEPAEEQEIRLPILAEDFRHAGKEVLDAVQQSVAEYEGLTIDAGNREGVRIQFGSPDTWTLLRLSVHDPLVVINAEAKAPGGVAGIFSTLSTILEGNPLLDISALKAHANSTL